MGIIAAALALAGLGAVPASAGNIIVTITGVRSDDGALMIGLYDSAEKFKDAIGNSAHIGLLSDKGRLIGVTMRARTGPQSIGFMALPPDEYAVIVFHDENDNGLLDENFVGIPTEAYGFSNNAFGFLKAPSFTAAAVTVADDNQNIRIVLAYPQAAQFRPHSKK